jgi:hypothetical protein
MKVTIVTQPWSKKVGPAGQRVGQGAHATKEYEQRIQSRQVQVPFSKRGTVSTGLQGSRLSYDSNDRTGQ